MSEQSATTPQYDAFITVLSLRPISLPDSEMIEYLKGLATAHKRWGFDKMMLKANNDCKPWNHKRVHRIYCQLGLNIMIRPRKRTPKGEAKVLKQAVFSNVCWPMDF